MGHPRGFLEVKRKDPGYRPVNKRTEDFDEVEKRLSEEEIKEQAARCMDCGIPFCHGCGCPLGNLIPEWNDLVYHGHWREALDLLYSTNPFPEFTGRICPALCEASCTVALNDDAVAIRQIEISLIEKGFEEGYIMAQPPLERSGKKVAVIGSGPAGLAVAEKLNKLGHKVTVYEQDSKPGGLLRYGIPDFKLEKQIIDRRLDLMRQEGIIFETDVEIGKDIAVDYLSRRFDVICLTCGARQPRDLDVPGRDLRGIHFAMDFLSQQNRINSNEPVNENQIISAKDKHVIVIGGGDTGSDCVGTSVRQGAASVTQVEIMPKPPEQRSESTPWPQWPYMLRSSSSHNEGCERHWDIMTERFDGKGGCVKKLKAVKVKWTMDKNGIPSTMKKVPKSKIEFKADLVLLAMGFIGPGAQQLVSDLELELDKRGNIKVDEMNMTNVKSVFATGDMVSGASLVVHAIGTGLEMADNVHKYLMSDD